MIHILRIHVFCIFILTISGISPAYSQTSNFIPCESYLDNNRLIKQQFENQLAHDIQSLQGKKKARIIKLYEQRTEYLIDKYLKGDFIKCPELDEILQDIISNLLTGNPGIRKPDIVLIDRNVTFNAYSFGEGTIGVHLGLFRRVNTESELAFLLAHELAHLQLDHANSRIKDFTLKYTKKGIKNSEIVIESTSAITSFIYEDYQYSRENELKADSMALTMLFNTKYDPYAYKTALKALDSARLPEFKNAPIIKNHFNFKQYPFNDHWTLGLQPALYNKDAPDFIFNRDSLLTHPSIQVRIAALDSIMLMSALSDNQNFIQYHSIDDRIKHLLDFEIVASSLASKDLANCLYYSLKMLEQYPEEIYFKKCVAKLLIVLYELRKDHIFGKYIPSSVDPSHWVKPYVDFLNNLRMSEFAELSYHFIQSNIKFDETDEEQYFMLWKASTISERETVSKNISQAYSIRFPDGKYKLTLTE